MASETGGQSHQRLDIILAFSFGILFVGMMLWIALEVEDPTKFQLFVFRIVLALAAAGIAAVIPGLLEVTIPNILKAGGALAVFVLIFWFNPPDLVLQDDPQAAEYTRLLDRGESELARNSYGAALDYFSKAAKVVPERWEAYNGMGRSEYGRGNYRSALEHYEQAFRYTDKKDGRIAYIIGLTKEGIGDNRGALASLDAAIPLLEPNSSSYGDVVFDKGLINLKMWLQEAAPREHENYDDSLNHFNLFLERFNGPDHWANYHLACSKAVRATDDALSEQQKAMLRDTSMALFDKSISELLRFKSNKAAIQQKMMRTIIESPERWKQIRKPGYPLACVPLVELWKARKGSVDSLLAELSRAI